MLQGVLPLAARSGFNTPIAESILKYNIYLMSTIKYSVFPPGVSILILCPLVFPIKTFPSGDLNDIFPLNTSASSGLTMEYSSLLPFNDSKTVDPNRR